LGLNDQEEDALVAFMQRLTDGYSSAAMKAKEHYDIGVPAPRLRIFVKAPWTDATRRTPF
jgi:hypothetical protein